MSGLLWKLILLLQVSKLVLRHPTLSPRRDSLTVMVVMLMLMLWDRFCIHRYLKLWFDLLLVFPWGQAEPDPAQAGAL